MNLQNGKELYSVVDIANALQLDTSTVRSYIKRGLLKPTSTVPTFAGHSAYQFDEATYMGFIRQCAPTLEIGEEIYSMTEAASYLGIGLSTLERLIRDGEITPDVVLPRGSTGHTSWRKFTATCLFNFGKTYFHKKRGPKSKNGDFNG